MYLKATYNKKTEYFSLYQLPHDLTNKCIKSNSPIIIYEQWLNKIISDKSKINIHIIKIDNWIKDKETKGYVVEFCDWEE